MSSFCSVDGLLVSGRLYFHGGVVWNVFCVKNCVGFHGRLLSRVVDPDEKAPACARSNGFSVAGAETFDRISAELALVGKGQQSEPEKGTKRNSQNRNT